MEKLERSKFTRAGEVANERLIEAVTDPDRYPEGTTFIAADQEGFGAILAESVTEHRPVAIFFPDGHEIVAACAPPSSSVWGGLDSNQRPTDYESSRKPSVEPNLAR
jgi:hypothetical protein